MPVIGIVGGDKRQEYLAEILRAFGFSVLTYGLRSSIHCTETLQELMRNSRVLVTPIPFTRNGNTIVSLAENTPLGIDSFISFLRSDHVVCGGGIPECVRSYCKSNGIVFFDLLESERLSYFNAIATAEGSIMEACQLSPMNFYKNHSIVIGYGRCGSILADRLKGMHSLVTVCEKREDLRIKAEVLGFQALDTDSLDQILPKALFVFNTAPALVLPEKLLKLLPSRAVIVDIASAPGGVDFKAADHLGIVSSLFLGIPGTVAPYSNAKILAEEVIKICDRI